MSGRQLLRTLEVTSLERDHHRDGEDVGKQEVAVRDELERKLHVEVGIGERSASDSQQRALCVQRSHLRGQPERPRGLERRLDEGSRGVVALCPDQQVDRSVEDERVRGRARAQDADHLVSDHCRRRAGGLALTDGMQSCDRLEARAVARPAQELAEPLGAQRPQRKLEPGEHHGSGLELERPFRVRLVTLLQERLERQARRLWPGERDRGAAQPDRRARVLGRVGRALERRQQVRLGRLAIEARGLQLAQIDEHRRPLLGGGRLVERTPQVADRSRRRAALGRARGGRTERRDGCGIAGGRGLQQMGGDALGGRPGLLEQSRDSRVAGGALSWEQVLVDRRLDDRMHEAELAVSGEDVRAHEQVGDAAGLLGIDSRRPGGQREVTRPAEYGDRAGQLGGGRAEPLEPTQDEAADGGRADRLDGRRGVRAWLHLCRVERGHELTQEQRVAAGGLVTGGAERAVDLGAEPAAQHLCHRGLRERAWAQDLGGWIARELAPELLAIRIRGTRRGEQQHRQPLDPARQVAEELQRGRVCPVRIVHGEHQRAVCPRD